jgi:hypothetical protein
MCAATGLLLACFSPPTAGGVAYATIPGDGNVYTACMLKSVGTIRLIDPSLPSTNLMSHCSSLEAQVSWNQKGQPGLAGAAGKDGIDGSDGAAGKDGASGNDGVSVTTAAEAPGAHCPGGGVQLTAVSGVNYVCNGTKGSNGNDGTSVTSATEPAGGNCARGGSKFTTASGVTYACNGDRGADGAGAPQQCVSPDGGTSVDVTGCTLLVLANTAATAITRLQGGVNGQMVAILNRVSTPTSLRAFGGNFAIGGSDITLGFNDTYLLVFQNGGWFGLGNLSNN